jgi:GT2 family glycosyltransferase
MGRTVSVVLVTWNDAPFLRRCLKGIEQQTHEDIEFIHVDNASGDDSAAIVRAQFPAGRQILNEENRGFAGAVNQAIRHARGELILLCNPDAYLERDYIARILEAVDAAGDEFGMATGKLFRARGYEIEPTELIDSKGIRMTRSGRHFDIGQGLPDNTRSLGLQPLRPATRDPRPAMEVFGVSGAAAVYRRSFIDAVSIDGEFFDEDFFTYREDADVAWRGRLFGWRAMVVPDAIAYHVRKVTPKGRRSLSAAVNMHSVKNRFLLRLKNEGLYLALRNAMFEIPRDIVTIAAVLTIERTSLPALKWLLRNWRRVLRKRRVIQQRRRVSDRALAEWFR